MVWAQELPHVGDGVNRCAWTDRFCNPKNTCPRTDRRVGSVLARVDIVFTEIDPKKLLKVYFADNAQITKCVDCDK